VLLHDRGRPRELQRHRQLAAVGAEREQHGLVGLAVEGADELEQATGLARQFDHWQRLDRGDLGDGELAVPTRHVRGERAEPLRGGQVALGVGLALDAPQQIAEAGGLRGQRFPARGSRAGPLPGCFGR
jgi:hypothetical protein